MTVTDEVRTLGPFDDWWYCPACGTANRRLTAGEKVELLMWATSEAIVGTTSERMVAWALEVWIKSRHSACDRLAACS